jgi:spermidine/putrescine transport system permease protein
VVQARLVGIRRDVEEAALSLGASPMQTFFEITLPLLLPAVLAGGLFAFTISFDDITGTLFWKPGGVETVPTQIFAMLRNSISPEINALGTVMIVLTVGLPLLGAAIARTTRRKKRRVTAPEPEQRWRPRWTTPNAMNACCERYPERRSQTGATSSA